MPLKIRDWLLIHFWVVSISRRWARWRECDLEKLTIKIKLNKRIIWLVWWKYLYHQYVKYLLNKAVHLKDIIMKTNILNHSPRIQIHRKFVSKINAIFHFVCTVAFNYCRIIKWAFAKDLLEIIVSFVDLCRSRMYDISQQLFVFLRKHGAFGASEAME